MLFNVSNFKYHSTPLSSSPNIKKLKVLKRNTLPDIQSHDTYIQFIIYLQLKMIAADAPMTPKNGP